MPDDEVDQLELDATGKELDAASYPDADDAEPNSFAFFSLEGDRFEAEGLPASAGREVAAYRDALVEIAVDLWKRDNPDRRRAPNRFAEAFDLRLTTVTGGSARPHLILNRPSRNVSDEDWSTWRPYYEQARDVATRNVREVQVEDAASTWTPGYNPVRFFTWKVLLDRRQTDPQQVLFWPVTSTFQFNDTSRFSQPRESPGLSRHSDPERPEQRMSGRHGRQRKHAAPGLELRSEKPALMASVDPTDFPARMDRVRRLVRAVALQNDKDVTTELLTSEPELLCLIADLAMSCVYLLQRLAAHTAQTPTEMLADFAVPDSIIFAIDALPGLTSTKQDVAEMQVNGLVKLALGENGSAIGAATRTLLEQHRLTGPLLLAGLCRLLVDSLAAAEAVAPSQVLAALRAGF